MKREARFRTDEKTSQAPAVTIGRSGVKARKRPKEKVFRIAFRNLGRHRVKTAITVIAVAIGILTYLYMDAYLLGVNTESKRNLVNYEMGAAKIYTKAYWDKKDEYPMYEGFANYTPVMEKLANAGYNSAPRATFVGSLLSVDEEVPFIFEGVDPAIERNMFLYHKYIEPDSCAHFIRDGEYEILIGVKGAKDLNVGVGDTVKLSTVIDKYDEAGELRHINQAIDLVVAGIINSPDPMVNAYTAFIPLSVLQDETGMLLEGAITELIVRKAGAREDELPGAFESVASIKRALGDGLPDELIVTGWEENAKDYLAASAGDIVSTVVFLAFFFVIVLMVIANTVLMSVLERTREIGMLRALGMTDNSVMRLIFVETGLIGFIGALIGLILFLPINYWMVNSGIDMSAMLEDTGITNLGYRVASVFKSSWNFTTMALSLIVTPVIASLTAFFPSRRAVRMSVSNALRMD
jgi:ABC-type lipoprotein release transport system permease subunit